MEKECNEWKVNAQDKQTTIEQQGRKISQLTADLKLANGNLEQTNKEHERQMNEMYNFMGPIRRWLWDLKHVPFSRLSDTWHN